MTTVHFYDMSGKLTSVKGIDRAKVDDPAPKVVRYQDRLYTFTGLAGSGIPVFHEVEPTELG